MQWSKTQVLFHFHRSVLHFSATNPSNLHHSTLSDTLNYQQNSEWLWPVKNFPLFHMLKTLMVGIYPCKFLGNNSITQTASALFVVLWTHLIVLFFLMGSKQSFQVVPVHSSLSAVMPLLALGKSHSFPLSPNCCCKMMLMISTTERWVNPCSCGGLWRWKGLFKCYILPLLLLKIKSTFSPQKDKCSCCYSYCLCLHK